MIQTTSFKQTPVRTSMNNYSSFNELKRELELKETQLKDLQKRISILEKINYIDSLLSSSMKL
ncbi:hypothetical protein KM1_028140 [Entamoeba histolytica HM-3:IMSS]|uniref:Uncharacterized protein n=1 Tax=Entamoeba histolytica HM-3:IMSS TaxID=885315 RepID=M7WTX1_ENTHI|nr:hypothetical protein KM1_028140 [Entamoeba histolytica HM-3:IMSS]